MTNLTEPRVAKWPFILGDLVLVGAAVALGMTYRANLLARPELLALFFGALAAGAGCLVTPWILELRAAVRLGESADLKAAADQWQLAGELATRIAQATAQWQGVQEQAGQTTTAAREIAARMAAETKSFTEFMRQLDDGEKQRLRMELEKLKRGEGEWIQAIVRLLDHTFLLHQAAVRSGKPGIAEQIGIFQSACRDQVRRVGVNHFEPEPGEPFDAHRHQVRDGQPGPEPGAIIAEALAPGYTFQGQLLRPALVRLAELQELAAEG